MLDSNDRDREAVNNINTVFMMVFTRLVIEMMGLLTLNVMPPCRRRAPFFIPRSYAANFSRFWLYFGGL
jgi:hypothetical protein